MTSKDFSLEEVATTLIRCVDDTFGKTYNIFFSKDPEQVQRDIIEYKSRVRTFGLEKFNAPCYVSAVNLYLSQKALEKNDTVGFLILYLNEEQATKILKAMGFTIKDDDEALFYDAVTELTNIIAEQFRKKMVDQKYQELFFSAPKTARNDIAEGVWFQYSERLYQEISFYLWNEKSLVISLSLAPIKRL